MMLCSKTGWSHTGVRDEVGIPASTLKEGSKGVYVFLFIAVGIS